MTEAKTVEAEDVLTEEEDDEREDYLDYCAAVKAIDEALETGEITPLEDFIKELGLENDCGF